MADLSNLLSDFNKPNIIEWLKDIGLFFRSPRQYVSKLDAKSTEDLLPQIIFYFIAYTFSYIFFSSASDFGTLIKPAILNLTMTIPLIAAFSLGSYIGTRSNYLKKTFILIISINFFVGPILSLVYALFLNSENYLYLLLGNLVNGMLILFEVLCYGFVLESHRKRALRITWSNYLFLSILYLVFTAINFDRDAPRQTTVSDDTILGEYREIVEPLKEKERTPTARFITTYHDKVITEVAIGNMIKDHEFKGSTDSNKIYRQNISVNLRALNSRLKDVKYRRNKKAILDWIKYYNAIAQQCDFKYHDTAQVFHDSTLHLIKLDAVAQLRSYSTGIRLDSIVATQMVLKSYHNNLIRVAEVAEYPDSFCNVILFLPGKIVEDVCFYLFIDGVKHVYKEQFHPFE